MLWLALKLFPVVESSPRLGQSGGSYWALTLLAIVVAIPCQGWLSPSPLFRQVAVVHKSHCSGTGAGFKPESLGPWKPQSFLRFSKRLQDNCSQDSWGPGIALELKMANYFSILLLFSQNSIPQSQCDGTQLSLEQLGRSGTWGQPGLNSQNPSPRTSKRKRERETSQRSGFHLCTLAGNYPQTRQKTQCLLPSNTSSGSDFWA